MLILAPWELSAFISELLFCGIQQCPDPGLELPLSFMQLGGSVEILVRYGSIFYANDSTQKPAHAVVVVRTVCKICVQMKNEQVVLVKREHVHLRLGLRMIE